MGNALTLSSTRNIVQKPQLVRVVQEAVRQQSETGYPQAIILSGCSGSGKTYASMLLLRQLFDVAGGGPETDAFKHLAAAFTVLRSLGSAKTQANSESSRIVIYLNLRLNNIHIFNLSTCLIQFAFKGPFYWSPSDGWCAVQDQDSLLFPGPDASCPAVSPGEELPHILPDVGRLDGWRASPPLARRLFGRQPTLPQSRWHAM